MRRRRKSLSSSLEVLEIRALLTSPPVQIGDIAWFADSDEAQFHRFDLQAETWMSPIRLDGASDHPEVFHVDEDGIFVARGKSLFRYTPGGTGGTPIFTAHADIRTIQSDGDLLFVDATAGGFDTLVSINKQTNTVIDSISESYKGLFGSSISISQNRIFGRTQFISPGDIHSVAYSDGGIFQRWQDSPYHGNFPGASETWTTADGLFVVDNYGVVMSSGSLQWKANLGWPIEDVYSPGTSQILALGDRVLTMFDSVFEKSSSRSLSFSTANAELFANDQAAFVFLPNEDASGHRMYERVALSSLVPPFSIPAADPNGLRFTPDAIEVANDGTVLLLSRENQSLFRWDPQTGTFRPSISLNGFGAKMGYSPEDNVVYVAYEAANLSYENGLIRRIDLNAASPRPEFFARVAYTPTALLRTGSYVFAAELENNWYLHTTFDLNGGLIESIRRHEYAKNFVWNDANQSVYFLGSTDVFREPINTDGVSIEGEPPGGIGDPVSSAMYSTTGMFAPIFVTPDGSTLYLGSGLAHDARTMQRITRTLQNSFSAVTSVGQELFTLRSIGGASQVQVWDMESLTLLNSMTTNGAPVGIQVIGGDRLLVLTLNPTGPLQFQVRDTNLARLDRPEAVLVGETDSATVVGEDGFSDEIRIRLNSAPEQDVVLHIRSSNENEVLTSATSLRFTRENWNVPQSISVTGVQDALSDGDQLSQLTISVDRSLSDVAWNDVADTPVVVRNLDDDGVFAGVRLERHQLGSISYFVRRSGSVLERFDLSTQQWLAPLRLQGTNDHPTSFFIDADGIYVAYGQTLYRYDLDGSNPVRLLKTAEAIWSIHTDGSLLFVVDRNDLFNRGMVTSLSKVTNHVIDMLDFGVNDFDGASISLEENRIFGVRPGSPRELSYMSYDDSGELLFTGESEYLPQSPYATRTWTFPGGAFAATNSGSVFSGGSLKFSGRLGGAFQDLAFLPDGRILVLSDRRLTTYSIDFYPETAVDLGDNPDRMSLVGDSIVTFQFSAAASHGVLTNSIPLSRLSALPLAAKVDPVSVSWTPNSVAKSNDGSVLLFSQTLRTIFRWDPRTRAYLEPIRLTGEPAYVTYSPLENVIYIADKSGLIRQIRLSRPAPKEELFAWLRLPAAGLEMAGRIVFAVDSGSFYQRHSTFLPSGERVSERDGYESSSDFEWNEANQIMYFPNFRSLDTEGINASGTRFPDIPLGSIVNYGGEWPTGLGNRFGVPIRVAPDGSILVTGSGQVFMTSTLHRYDYALPGPLTDMIWFNGLMTTLRAAGTGSRLESWKQTSHTQPFVAEDFVTLDGLPLALVSTQDDVLLAITEGPGKRPQFTLINSDMEKIPATPAIIPQAANTFRHGPPTVKWTPDPAAASYDIQVRQGSRIVATYRVAGDQSSLTISDGLVNGEYDVRIRSITGGGAARPWSASWKFFVDRLSLTQPRPLWTDTETSFRLTGHSIASRYEIWIDNRDTGNIFYRAVQDRLQGTSIQMLTVPQRMPAARYSAWVRSFDAQNRPSAWVERRDFEVIAPLAQITAGAGHTNDSTPKLQWASIPEAESYEIVVQTVATRLNVVRRIEPANTSYTVTQRLLPGAYNVWIRAWKYGRSISSWGPGTRLVVQAPPVVSASRGALKWGKVPEALSYDLRVEDNAGSVVLDVQQVTGLGITDSGLVPGRYRVFARSNFANGNQSELLETQLEIFHPSIELSPVQSETMDQTPVLTWNPAAGASLYEVQVRRTRDNSMLYSATVIGRTSHRVDVRLPNGAVTVWVRGYFDNGSRSSWGPGASMVIGPAPRLQRPNDKLIWTAVPSATHYELWINVVEPGKTSQTTFLRSGLITTISHTLPKLAKGRYSAWIRAVRAEAGALYTGSWSDLLDFTI